MVSANANFEGSNGWMSVSEPLTANRVGNSHVFGFWNLDAREIALVAHTTKLARKGLDLAALRRVHQDGMAIAGKSVCRTDAELLIILRERVLPLLFGVGLFYKSWHKGLLSFDKRKCAGL